MPTIDALAFLAGSWQQGDSYELQFTAPKSASMLGTLRHMAAGSTLYFEFFHFAEEASGLIFNPYVRGRHVGPCPLLAVESKDGAQRFVFENPAQTEYRLIWFESDPSGSSVRMGTAGTKAGQAHLCAWTFTRQAPSPADADKEGGPRQPA